MVLRAIGFGKTNDCISTIGILMRVETGKVELYHEHGLGVMLVVAQQHRCLAESSDYADSLRLTLL